MQGPREFPTTANVGRLIEIFAKQYEENPRVVLRELIQNAADAITTSTRQDPRHSGRIEVEIMREQERTAHEIHLAVRDTAMGMDATALQNYLGCLGEGSKADDIDTIGEWGIGFFAVVVACPWAIIATKRTDTAPIAYRYSVEDHTFVQLEDPLARWVTEREFGSGGAPARPCGTTVFLHIDFKRFPALKDWLVPQRLLTELRTFCLLVAHPIAVRNGETGETTTINLSVLPWNSNGPDRDRALQALWSAILPNTKSESYPRLAHVFARAQDADAEFSGVLYFVPGYRGGTSLYFKSMYVEHAMDMLPTWASVFTLLLNGKTSPRSAAHHLEVPPSRTHVVRNDAFFRLLSILEDEAVRLVAAETEGFRRRLEGLLTDPERRAEAVRKAAEDSPIIDALSAIRDVEKSICLDVASIMAEAIGDGFREPFYKDAVLALLSARGLSQDLKRDGVMAALSDLAENGKRAAANERVVQRANKTPPTWYPESSRRFVLEVAEHSLVHVVVKEYPIGSQPRFEEVRIPVSCIALLDPALDLGNGVIRLPVLTKGDAREYLYSADQDRVVIVAQPEEVLLLMCMAHATKRYNLDLVHSGRTKFQPIGSDEDWSGVIAELTRLAMGHKDGSGTLGQKLCDTVDVARYDREELPLVLREVDGQRHLTINGQHRGMEALNKALNRARTQGLATIEKALHVMVHELYHSSLFYDDCGPDLATLHLLEVRQFELWEICGLINQLIDLRSARAS